MRHRPRTVSVLIFCALLLADTAGAQTSITDYQKIIVAGDPDGAPPDSPSNRIDANVTSSPFGGVGSISFGTSTTASCTGTLIDPFGSGVRNVVLTAGHCVDLNDDGTIDVSPSNLTFNVNFDGNLSSQIVADQVSLHPDFSGFANPVVNDDLALLRLSSPVPAGVPTYSLYRDPLVAGDTLTSVGYGRSGNGVDGYTVGSSRTIKRVGSNNADDFDLDDEGSGAVEVFVFDFDGPTSDTNTLGGLTLGKNVETTFGGGDSGGPSFLFDEGQWKVAGVNTFVGVFAGLGISAPLFGSAGGGVVVSSSADWIDSVAVPEPSSFALAGLAAVAIVVYERRRRSKKLSKH